MAAIPNQIRRFQSRKRFRHCWSSPPLSPHNRQIHVSIAKAIPSLLELPDSWCTACALSGFNRESDSVTVGAVDSAVVQGRVERFNRESDSVTVGAMCQLSEALIEGMFQSRKRFRHCWSLHPLRVRSPFVSFNRESDSVTVGAPSLFTPERERAVSIAKAIPSLLERTPL